jgi:periplasmic protein TonB
MSYQALLFCPDEKTARVVTQVLTELDFMVEPCNEPFAAVKKLMGQHFDAVVVDSDNEQNATLLFKSARNSSTNNSSLAVAVVEGQAGVAKAFRIGANLVLTKPINVEQSKGTLRVARGLLRKGTETAKTNAIPLSPIAPASPASRPVDVSAPPSAFPPLTAARPQPPTTVTPPAASQLEVEKEPEPQPEPTEMALLESMPDAPAHAVSSPAASSKDFPWQAPAKPMAEPMGSAMRRAAEAAGQKIGNEASAVSRPSSGLEGAWGSGAAAAPAPAKEKPRSVTPAIEPDLDVIASAPAAIKPFDNAGSGADAPSFSSFDDTAEAKSGGGSKALPIAIALVLLVAACAYFAWTKFHLGTSSQYPVSQSAVPAQKAPAPQNTAPETATVPSAAPPAAGSEAVSGATTGIAPESKPSAAVPKDTLKEDHEAEVPSTSKLIAPVKAPEPVIVRTESPKPETHKPVEDAVAPPELGSVSGESGSRAISGIVSSTPIAVPQRPAETLKVSQGVSQGLLLKRVQPLYPPQALQIRLQGAVQMQATISKEGTITNVKVLSGESMLARSAVDAVRQWKYKPYYLNGEPVDIQTQITINFKLP